MKIGLKAFFVLLLTFFGASVYTSAEENAVTTVYAGNVSFQGIASDAQDNLFFKRTQNYSLTLGNGNVPPSFGRDSIFKLISADGTGKKLNVTPYLNFSDQLAAVDSNGGVLFHSNSLVKRWDPISNKLDVIAGTFEYISSLAFDKNGLLYVVDSYDGVLKRIDPATNKIETVLAQDDRYGIPLSIVRIDHNGQVYVGDGSQIYNVDLNKNSRTSSTLPPSYSYYASDFVFDSQNRIYIADSYNNVVNLFDPTTNKITPFAGTGKRGNSGENVSATQGELFYPNLLAIDSDDNLYIGGNYSSYVIRRVDNQTKTITTYVGNGTQGHSGDGVSALEAELSGPRSIACSPNGALFILDNGSYDYLNSASYDPTIRVVDRGSPPMISTAVGTLLPNQASLDVLAGENQSGRSSSFAHISGGLAFNVDGNLFFGYSSVVRSLNLQNGTISTPFLAHPAVTFPGDGGPAISAALRSPGDICFAPDGAMYILEIDSGTIRKISKGTGIISTIPGIKGSYNYVNGHYILGGPAAIAIGPDGALFVADYSHVIRRIDLTTNVITTVVGTENVAGYHGDGGPATDALLNFPLALAFDDNGNMFIGDSGNNRVRCVDSKGIITTYAGDGTRGANGDNGPAMKAQFGGEIFGLACDHQGNLYISDFDNGVVRRVDSQTQTMTTIAGGGYLIGSSGDGQPAIRAQISPDNLAIDSKGNLYIADYEHNSVRKVDGVSGKISSLSGNSSPGYSGDGGPVINAAFDGVLGIAFDTAGNLCLADNRNNVIRKVDASTGIVVTISGTVNPVFDYPGDGESPLSALFSSIADVCVGEQGNIYVADSGASRIRKISNGNIATFAGNGNQISSIATTGSARSTGVNATNLAFISPNLFLSDGAGIRAIGTNGSFSGAFSDSHGYVSNLTATSDSQLVFANSDVSNYLPQIQRSSADLGQIQTIAHFGLATGEGTNALSTNFNLGYLNHSIAAGPNGSIYFSDSNGGVIRKIGSGSVSNDADVDTDGDGFPDTMELAAGSDPGDRASTPYGLNPANFQAGYPLTINSVQFSRVPSTGVTPPLGKKHKEGAFADRMSISGIVPPYTYTTQNGVITSDLYGAKGAFYLSGLAGQFSIDKNGKVLFDGGQSGRGALILQQSNGNANFGIIRGRGNPTPTLTFKFNFFGHSIFGIPVDSSIIPVESLTNGDVITEELAANLHLSLFLLGSDGKLVDYYDVSFSIKSGDVSSNVSKSKDKQPKIPHIRSGTLSSQPFQTSGGGGNTR